jgi:hypothetical protein
MYPMQAEPNEIRMLSVKKEHPLAGNCDSRRRNCTGRGRPSLLEMMYQPATNE